MSNSNNKLKTGIYSLLLLMVIIAAGLLVTKRYSFGKNQDKSDAADAAGQVISAELQENQTAVSDQESIEISEDETSSEYLPEEISLFGKNISTSETYLDLSQYSEPKITAEIDNLAVMQNLTEINFLKSDGSCSVGIETLNSVHAVLPDTVLDCSFELLGKTVSSKDARIEYIKEDIGNDGIDEIRSALPLLTSCEYFLLDDCGIDNEVLAELRDDFPERNIVWRIFMTGNDSYLTDITVFRCTKICDADNEQFKYCSALKYIDVGHTLHNLSDISFTAYMPNLEVLILAHSDVSDLSPLSNCKNLEFLEIFCTKVSDISPLAECENLQHLNMTCQANINDLTPLYGLTKMKRLRLDVVYFPQEQLDTITRLMPECAMEFGDGDDILGGWRYYLIKGVPEMASRYELLREQMQYGNGDSYVK